MDRGLKCSFELSGHLAIDVPEKHIEEAFWIAAKLVADMRRLAFEYYGKDGWLAVSDGKVGPQHSYDPRDFRYGPKCAAYLYGGNPSFVAEMGRRIFHDEIDGDNGYIRWDHGRHQTAIHLAQTVKHFSDYLVYAEQDEFVRTNWDRLLRMVKWAFDTYDKDGDHLFEQGPYVSDHFWALLVGEPYNFPYVEDASHDVVVVATMEVCELLQLMADLARRHGLAGSDWLSEKAAKVHQAIEGSAYDPDCGYYYLLHRACENKWYHSMLGINEESRELDVTPYYAALVSGNYSRAVRVTEYARSVLLDYGVFPMPLHFPGYFWKSPNYGSAQHFVPGGCWEESYYNCVRAFSHCGMLDAVYEAVKRRSAAHVRDGDCLEWYAQDGTIQGHCRDRYGISAGAHVSAVIEGLFGITPRGFGFDEVNIHPNVPAHWVNRPVTISVSLPNNGFLKYTYRYDTRVQCITVAIETDKRRTGHFRVFVPGAIDWVKWNSEPIKYNSGQRKEGGAFVYVDRDFTSDSLTIKVGTSSVRRTSFAGFP